MDFIQYGLLLAKAASMRSEDQFMKVGAVGFNENKRIVSTGYNGYQQGQHVHPAINADRDLRRKYILHAENNCFANCRRGEIFYLFLTMSPCEMCAKSIVAHDVKFVCFPEVYDKCDAFRDIFDFYNIQYKLVEPDYYVGSYKIET